MKRIVLRFLATKGFVSDAIKLVEGISYIDHVEALNRAGDRWTGAHAGTGVAELPLDWAKDIVWERQYSVPVTDEEYALFHGNLEAKLGTKYDYAAILGDLFHDRKLDDHARAICSALQCAALWAARLKPINVEPQYVHLVTPETLHFSSLLVGCCTYKFPAAA